MRIKHVPLEIQKSLDQPSAERIKQLEEFSTEFDKDKFDADYGHSEQFSLDKVFWWCCNMFSQV
jgi:hypothetical protein